MPRLPSVGIVNELSGRRLSSGLNELCAALGAAPAPAPLPLPPAPIGRGSTPSDPAADDEDEGIIGLLSAVAESLLNGPPRPSPCPPPPPVARKLPMDMPKPKPEPAPPPLLCCSRTGKLTIAVAILVGYSGGGMISGSFGEAPGAGAGGAGALMLATKCAVESDEMLSP